MSFYLQAFIDGKSPFFTIQLPPHFTLWLLNVLIYYAFLIRTEPFHEVTTFQDLSPSLIIFLFII
jgi:hypothetical protein